MRTSRAVVSRCRLGAVLVALVSTLLLPMGGARTTGIDTLNASLASAPPSSTSSQWELLSFLGSKKKDKAKVEGEDHEADRGKKEVPKEVDRNVLPATVQRAALVLVELENCGSEVFRDILHDASK